MGLVAGLNITKGIKQRVALALSDAKKRTVSRIKQTQQSDIDWMHVFTQESADILSNKTNPEVAEAVMNILAQTRGLINE